ncbi:MAG: hypothetical protein R8G66_29660 [Cytophagales bacterium]|nr:hypothetical protein [Cytophagales bacterium]
MPRFFPLLFLFSLAACQSPENTSINFSLTEQQSGTDALLIAMSILDGETVWMSGTQSTFLRTMDGGESWELFSHPEIDTFQYRDIHAFDDESVALLSIGEGANSQIHLYSESAGWKVTYVMDHPNGFLNSIDFWDDQIGLAYGDSFDGKPYLMKTEDGGHTWSRIDPEVLPDAEEGEGGFASSGSCISVQSGGLAWIGTGAGGSARVLKTTDYGESWASYETPIIKGDAAGITSIHFRNDNHGLIAGGDLAITDIYTENLAFSIDGGQSWVLTEQPETTGAFYGSDLISMKGKTVVVACGPKGADITFDAGLTWNTIATDNLWVADLHADGYGWLAGRAGKILKLELN